MKTLLTTFLFLMGLLFACEHNQNNTTENTSIMQKNDTEPSDKENSKKNSGIEEAAVAKKLEVKNQKNISLFITDSIPEKQKQPLHGSIKKQHHSMDRTTILEPGILINASKNITIAASKPETTPQS